MLPDLDRVLLEQSPDAIIASGMDGRILYWSKGAEAAFGYTSAEAIGNAVQDLIVPPNRVGEARALYRQAFTSGFSAGETIRRKKDGGLVYVDLSHKVVRGSRGVAEFVLSNEKDITKRKIARDAKLIASRFGDLLEALPDSIVMVNAIGRIVMSNRQAEHLFGYNPDELSGQSIEVLLPQRFHEPHVKHRAHYFVQPHARSMGIGLQLYGVRKDGTEFPVEVSLSPMQLDEGTLVSSAIRDITERKRFESVLQEKNADLTRANQAKDSFLAGMSHELRTPLNAIIGFTGTLLMGLPGPLNADQQKQLQTIQSSGRHLLTLINDLLDLAKIGAGTIEMTVEDVIVQDVVGQVAAELRPEAMRKGLGFEIRMPESDLLVKTDRRALRQMVLNLLGNAIKFTDEGAVGVVVNRLEADGSRTTEIVIVDTGIGICADDQTHLFEAFVRVDSARRKLNEGTGLGLHLSQKLARHLGGRIACCSEYGKGSTFTLILPEGEAS